MMIHNHFCLIDNRNALKVISKCCYSEHVYFQISIIQIILLHTKIAFYDIKIAMIINIHNNNWGYLLACPSMISPCFSQSVTSDCILNPDSLISFVHDSPCLYPTKRFPVSIIKYIFFFAYTDDKVIKRKSPNY